MKKEKKGKKNEEVCEIFEVEKEGKTKVVKTCGVEENIPTTKDQIKKQNKILRNILITLGIVALLFITIIFYINSVRHFEYSNTEFEVVKEGNLILYKTSLPVKYQGQVLPYNFYLRNDPRKLENVSFEGEIVLMKDIVINLYGDFDCEGDGMIAIANLLTLYDVLELEVIKDDKATCDPDRRYTHIKIQEGDVTNIRQIGPSCYEINVNNCEILPVMEKFMVETFSEINAYGGELLFSFG